MIHNNKPMIHQNKKGCLEDSHEPETSKLSDASAFGLVLAGESLSILFQSPKEPSCYHHHHHNHHHYHKVSCSCLWRLEPNGEQATVFTALQNVKLGSGTTRKRWI